MTKRRVIGKGGRLPWNIPEEASLFKKTTEGSVVIMGRKTFLDVGVLSGRKTIVVSRTLGARKGIEVCGSLGEALEKAGDYGREIFIIGGGEIFAQSLNLADRMYISYIRKDYDGDAFFPEFDEQSWKAVERKDYEEFEQVVYVRA